MTDLMPEYKRNALKLRQSQLIEEYEAVNSQLAETLGAADRIRIQRQVRSIEQELGKVEKQLHPETRTEVDGEPDDNDSKAIGGAESKKDVLHGTGNRWALLVGVDHYDDGQYYGDLKLCKKDVSALRDQLVTGGFEPERLHSITGGPGEEPTRSNVLANLKSIADATEPDDLLLFYYSGHGDQAEGESYLVGQDGRHLVLSDTAIAVSRVKQILEDSPARAKVIILDACHSGADIGSKGPKPMTAEFINRVFEQAEGLAILASCKQGQLSYEWREAERGVFTHYLLEALGGKADRDEKGFVTVQDASRHVTNGVKLWASQKKLSQTPTLEYRVAGDIILTRLQSSGS